MKCPICPDSPLLISEGQGVEIDYCAQCRGVWLDRGELDKLMAFSPVALAPPDRERRPPGKTFRTLTTSGVKNHGSATSSTD